MGFRYHKKLHLSKRLSLNLAKTGPSLSLRLGRVSLNLSRRGLSSSVRLLKGLSYRFLKSK